VSGGFTAAELAGEIAALNAEVAALRAFKAYVHKRLDDAGVPADPPGPHRDAGCRIGQRLDLVLNAKAVCDDCAACAARRNAERTA
jgi:hypothetical protein